MNSENYFDRDDTVVSSSSDNLTTSRTEIVTKAEAYKNAMLNFLQAEGNKNFSLIPDSVKAALASGHADLVLVELEAMKMAMYETKKLQIQIAKEELTQILKRTTAGGQAATANFMFDQVQKAQQKIDDAFDKLTATILRKLEEAPSIKNNMIREMRLKQLEEDFKKFANLRDRGIAEIVRVFESQSNC